MIADSRFHKNIVTEIENLHNQVVDVCDTFDIPLHTNNIFNFVDFKDGTTQYRVDYRIEKTKAHTYNQIYSLINNIKAVPYTVK